jgi:hypothetical protein
VPARWKPGLRRAFLLRGCFQRQGLDREARARPVPGTIAKIGPILST